MLFVVKNWDAMGEKVSKAVTTCNADEAPPPPSYQKEPVIFPPRDPRQPPDFDDQDVGCAARVDGVKQCMATTANMRPGVSQLSQATLVNHELLQAAQSGDARMLAGALDRGAWIETRRPLVMRPQKHPDGGDRGVQSSNVGMTALMYASMQGSEECVKRLVYAGANVNAIDEDGDSPLMFAAKEGNLEVCKFLIKQKADVSVQNDDDKTPLDVCLDEHKAELARIVQMVRR